jgi:hypothetical protein
MRKATGQRQGAVEARIQMDNLWRALNTKPTAQTQKRKKKERKRNP